MYAFLGAVLASLTLAQPVPTAAEAAPADVRLRALAPAMASGVTAIAGATFLALGEVELANARALPAMEEVEAARGHATANVVGGVALLGFGALTAGLAAALFFWAPAPPGTQVALAPLPGGGLFSLGLRLP